MNRAERLKQLEQAADGLPEDTPDLGTIKDLIKMFRLLVEKGTITNEAEVDRWVNRIARRIRDALEKPKT